MSSVAQYFRSKEVVDRVAAGEELTATLLYFPETFFLKPPTWERLHENMSSPLFYAFAASVIFVVSIN